MGSPAGHVAHGALQVSPTSAPAVRAASCSRRTPAKPSATPTSTQTRDPPAHLVTPVTQIATNAIPHLWARPTPPALGACRARSSRLIKPALLPVTRSSMRIRVECVKPATPIAKTAMDWLLLVPRARPVSSLKGLSARPPAAQTTTQMDSSATLATLVTRTV